MNAIGMLAIVALAGLIHASFQLSVSMLTLLSGHAIGRKTAHRRLLRLLGYFLLGTATMTLLLISSVTVWLQASFGDYIPLLAWAMACGLLIGLGVAVWLFYYRREPGTSLWLPRELARYLMSRSKITHFTGEAFSLGMTSTIAELVFIAGPVIVAGLLLTQMEPIFQLAGLGIYTLSSLLSLAIVAVLIATGHSIGRIQQWREANKGFLQVMAGIGLIVLAFCVYVNEISGSTLFMGGGR